MIQNDHAMPATPRQPNPLTPTLAHRNAPYPATLCFLDHLQRRSMVVPVSEVTAGLSMPSSPFSRQTAGYSTPSPNRQPHTPINPGLSGQGPLAKRERPQVTIQLYLLSNRPAFNSEHGLKNVEQWCKQLQLSEGFRYLRNQITGQYGPSGILPTIHIEAYEALPSYKVCIAILFEVPANTFFIGNH
jgi:hypothetical protein